MTGVGIMLMSGDVARGSICCSNRVSALIEDLQYTLGEGPCVDAYRQDEPVLEPDLGDRGRSRWVAFTPRAVEAGARAGFGVPLRVASLCSGVRALWQLSMIVVTPCSRARRAVTRCPIAMSSGVISGPSIPWVSPM
jgi:hypothetical protein